uniref:Putative sugar transporter sweet1-like protein n=2 Tax=Ixodes ricinus TaxID=34613 RepID=A0A090X7R5_IXORI
MWVNSIGLLLQLSFLICFHLHTKLKTTPTPQNVHAGSHTCRNLLRSELCRQKIRTRRSAFLASLDVLPLLFFLSSPLANSRLKLFGHKVLKRLPFPLILSAFLVSSLWTLYGVLCDDVFIYVSIVQGILLMILAWPSLQAFLLSDSRSGHKDDNV